MSWVGPRPEALVLGQRLCPRHSALRLRASSRRRTGWAQINQGYVYAPDGVRAKLEYDLYYLKHCLLWLDLVIILRTLAVIWETSAKLRPIASTIAPLSGWQ